MKTKDLISKVVIKCDTCKLRQRIFDMLYDRPMYLSELAKEIMLDRTTLSYHLSQMEHEGLLDSYYKILDTKKAARYYKVRCKEN